jgi:hypothetical protein
MNESHFPRIMKYLKDIKSRYFRAFSAFHVFETLQEAIAINVVGKERAEQNLEVINKFKDFFLISKESLRVYFFLELAKLFDTSGKSLQINKIINITESNISKLTVDDFEDFNKDRQLIAELIKGYKGITHNNLNEIRKILTKEQPIIDKLKVYRDKWLAHDDIDKPETPAISSLELRSLFDSFAKIMNIFSTNMNHESTIWNHIEESSKFDTQYVLDYLYRFEKYRIQEIEGQAGKELEKFNKLRQEA